MGKRFLHCTSLLKNIRLETASHLSINSEIRLSLARKARKRSGARPVAMEGAVTDEIARFLLYVLR